jgi:two-component sensor histidine kinase
MSPDFANPSAATPPLALHLVEEISHRVINEYTEAIAILSLAASRGRGTADPALALAAERLAAMAEAHRSLLVPVDDEAMDLGLHLGKLCASLSRASLGERGIRLTVVTDEIWIDAPRCWRVGLIVSELVRNAVRHGLKGRRGSIRVALNARNGRAWCVVCDDGYAPPNPPEGRGRRLIRALATELAGTVEWKFTQAGSVVGLQFPVATSLLSYPESARRPI